MYSRLYTVYILELSVNNDDRVRSLFTRHAAVYVRQLGHGWVRSAAQTPQHPNEQTHHPGKLIQTAFEPYIHRNQTWRRDLLQLRPLQSAEARRMAATPGQDRWKCLLCKVCLGWLPRGV